MIYRDIIKRILDFIIALILIILLFPIFLVISLLIFFETKSSPFFIQKRIGYKGKSFNLLKFKKLKDCSVDKQGRELSEDERLLKVGKFLKLTSFDELPQLFNILKGDMSFIGPRPLLERYRLYYTPREFRRHDVRPGILGWAQLNGRKTLIWEQRFEYDLEYVENVSFKFDLMIFIKTVLMYANFIKQEKGLPITPLRRFDHWRRYVRLRYGDEYQQQINKWLETSSLKQFIKNTQIKFELVRVYKGEILNAGFVVEFEGNLWLLGILGEKVSRDVLERFVFLGYKIAKEKGLRFENYYVGLNGEDFRSEFVEVEVKQNYPKINVYKIDLGKVSDLKQVAKIFKKNSV